MRYVACVVLVAIAAASSPRQAGAETTDVHGDPLPEGAVARLGTVRFNHGERIDALAAAADGNVVASIGSNGRICLWDSADGRLIQEIKLPKDGRSKLARLSADGSRIATRASDGAVCVWETSTGRVLGRVPGGAESDARGIWLAFSPDGRRLALVDRKDALQVYDAETGLLAWKLKGKAGEVGLAAFSPDGRGLACVLPGGRISVLDAGTGKKLAEGESTLRIGALFFTTRGLSLVAVGVHDGAEIRDAGSLEVIRTIPEREEGSYGQVQVSRDGLRMLRPSAEGVLHVLDVATLEEVASVRLPTGSSVRFLRDGRELLAATGPRLARLDLQAEAPAPVGNTSPVWSIQVSPDDKHLVTHGGNETLCWDPAQPRSPILLPGSGVAFRKGGADLLVALSGEIVVLDPATGQVQSRTRRDWGDAEHLRLSPEGSSAASLVGGRLQVWDVESGEMRFEREYDYRESLTGRFSADGKWLAVDHAGNGVWARTTLFSVASGKEVEASSVDCCMFERVGITWGGEGLDVYCSVHGIHSFPVEVGRNGPAAAGEQGPACESPDRSWVAVRDGATRVRIFSKESRSRALSLDCGPVRVTSLRFSADGKLLYTGAEDGNVLAWELAALTGH